MGIFNSKSDNDAFSPQDLKELFQRLEHLERKCRRLDARIAELEDEFASQRNRGRGHRDTACRPSRRQVR